METKKKSLGSEVVELLKNNVKIYMMYFALVIIMLVFQIWSGGKFFKASNITNLFNQAAYVGVLAIGSWQLTWKTFFPSVKSNSRYYFGFHLSFLLWAGEYAV